MPGTSPAAQASGPTSIAAQHDHAHNFLDNSMTNPPDTYYYIRVIDYNKYLLLYNQIYIIIYTYKTQESNSHAMYEQKREERSKSGMTCPKAMRSRPADWDMSPGKNACGHYFLSGTQIRQHVPTHERPRWHLDMSGTHLQRGVRMHIQSRDGRKSSQEEPAGQKG
jgi:hypothetical protein